jgi:hypothetical protein
VNGPLSDAEFARLFAGMNTIRPGEDALDLEPRVEAWLSQHGMTHRSALRIAREVTRLAPEPPPARVPTPEEAAWQGAGYGNNRQALTEAELASHVQNMSLAEYVRARGSLTPGLERSLIDFLGGTA